MYDIQTYLAYCRLIEILQKKGAQARDDEEVKNLVENLPLSPVKMQASLDNNWKVILHKMDRGIREDLQMKIPPDEHERFLVTFCREYKKRYGLDFWIPKEEDYEKGNVPPHIEEEKKRSKQTYGSIDIEQNIPEPFEDTNYLRETGETSKRKPKKKRDKPGKHGKEASDAAVLFYARKNLVTGKKSADPREYLGAPVIYNDGVYIVVEVGRGGVLFIDRETKWSETTAVRPEDVRLL